MEVFFSNCYVIKRNLSPKLRERAVSLTHRERKKLDRTHPEEPFRPKNLSWSHFTLPQTRLVALDRSHHLPVVASTDSSQMKGRNGGASCLIAQCWHKPSREWHEPLASSVSSKRGGRGEGVTEGSQSRAIEDELWTEGEEGDRSRERSVHFPCEIPLLRGKLWRKEGGCLIFLQFLRQLKFESWRI